MQTRRIIVLPLVAALSLSPATSAIADADGLVGGIIGGIIGGAIINESNKNRQRQYQPPRNTIQPPRNTMSSATREANREVQTSLNYFGFPAGTPDGVMGQRSRSAASQYQAHLGYVPTGQLTDYERTFLVSSYQRAIMVSGRSWAGRSRRSRSRPIRWVPADFC